METGLPSTVHSLEVLLPPAASSRPASLRRSTPTRGTSCTATAPGSTSASPSSTSSRNVSGSRRNGRRTETGRRTTAEPAAVYATGTTGVPSDTRGGASTFASSWLLSRKPAGKTQLDRYCTSTPPGGRTHPAFAAQLSSHPTIISGPQTSVTGSTPAQLVGTSSTFSFHKNNGTKSKQDSGTMNSCSHCALLWGAGSRQGGPQNRPSHVRPSSSPKRYAR